MTDDGINDMQGHIFTLLCAVRVLFATHPDRDWLLSKFSTAFAELQAVAHEEPSAQFWYPAAEAMFRQLSARV